MRSPVGVKPRPHQRSTKIALIYNGSSICFLLSVSWMMRDIHHCRALLLVLAVFGGVAAFIPFYADIPFENNKSNAAIKSAGLQQLAVMCMGIAATMVLEASMDLQLALEVTIPRWIFVISLGATHALVFFLSLPSHLELKLYVCSFYARILMTRIALSSHFITKRSSTKYQSCVVFEIILGLIYSIIYISVSDHNEAFDIVNIIVLALLTIGLIAIAVHGYRLYTSYADFASAPSADQLSLMHISLLLVHVLGIAVASELFPSKRWADFSAAQFASYNVIDLLVCVVAFSLPGRIARSEAVILKVQLPTNNYNVRSIIYK